ncbi:MAG: DinB family protein [Candidatus Hodarchaeota archaeon]
MGRENKNKELGITLLSQFNRNWNMLHQAIDNVPEELWKEVQVDDFENTWSYLWNIFHIIETADFYSRNTPENMEWGKRAGINWDNDPPEVIVNKKDRIQKSHLKEYLKEIEDRITEIFDSKDDLELFKKDNFHWFQSIFEKYLYLLRHDMHHIGELNKALRDWKCTRISWQ